MRGVIRPLLLACGLVLAWALPAAAAPTWSAPVSLSTPGNVVTYTPSIAMSDAGYGSEAWAETVGGKSVVRVALHAPGGPWSTFSGDISSGLPGDQCTPFTSIGPNGNAVVVWAQFSAPGCGGTQTILASTHAGGSASWSSPIVVGAAATPGDWALQGAANSAGQIVVAWETADMTNNHVLASVGNPSGVFSAAAPIEQKPLASYLSYLTAAIGQNGDAAVQWNDNEYPTGTSNIIASVRPRDGSFPSTPSPVTTLTSPQSASEGTIAVDAAGDVLSAYPNAIGGQTYASRFRTASNGVWQAEETIDVPQFPYTPSWVAVGLDAAGNATAAMVDTDFSSPSPHQRQLWTSTRPAGSSSTWKTAVSIGDPQASNDFETYIAVAPSGAAEITWGSASPTQSAQATYRPAGGDFGAPVTAIGTGDGALPAISPSGDALVSLLGSASDAQVAVLDRTIPSISAVTVPASATTGQPVAMSTVALDAWSGLGSGQPTWTFGDGGAGAGLSVSHTFAAPGTYTVTVSARDGVGFAAAPVARQIVVSNPPPPPPSAPPAIAVSKLAVTTVWKASRLVGSVTISGTVGAATTLTIEYRLHGAKKIAGSSSSPVAAGPWSRTLKLPAGLAPGHYDLSATGKGVISAGSSFTIAAPKSGIVSHSYASGLHHGPAVTRLAATSELWAHFSFSTLPAKGQKITTQWTLPGGRKLAANARTRTRLVEAVVQQAGAKPLPKGPWHCVVRAGGVIVATLNVRLS